ncbi:diacylglycerol kinase family protein [Rhodoferax sp.]|uniref:diacylglycerol/lipid kinase family protein n=1 Tax=Rhodoferax sp. TaxID=50421 RepID=UPI0025DDF652|nr:diacylglycerol kinase family protein [Rhodoferax sp.]
MSDAQSSRVPDLDRAATLLFVINAASGHHAVDATRELIESALRTNGRSGELLFARPQDLAEVARQAAATACTRRSAVVAVGGDGTINTVAQAAYAQGCAMGVLPQGTFNYFARTHGIPGDGAQALQTLLDCEPMAVQVGLINERVFLVNASLGLYPELLQDREAWKARFGRSRVVAFAAALATLLGRRRQLRLRIERGTTVRDVSTPTLFIGNNRLQFEQVGLAQAGALDQGCLAAVMLRPIGSMAMLWLLLRGSFGTLGEADSVESVQFQRMLVTPRVPWLRRRVKVAFDGEVGVMRAPIEFRVAPKPLYLIKPVSADGATGQSGGGA